MPGIIVIVDKNLNNYDRNVAITNKMTNKILHEPFYKSASINLKKMGVCARNVFIDEENQCEKLYINSRKNLMCMLNGEMYDKSNMYLKIIHKEEIIDKNNSSELIAKLYEENGIDFLKILNGCFSLLLIDTLKDIVILANDRINFYRNYHCRAKDGSYILAPEVKCFGLYPDIDLDLNLETMIQNFKYDTVLGNNSHYKGIFRLPNSSAFVIKNNTSHLHEYWNPSNVTELGRMSEKVFREKFLDTFVNIMDEHITPGKTGLSMTGGWDTRTILSVLTHKKINMPCYTFGGKYKDSSDVKLAKRIAKIAGNDHHTIVIGDKFLNNIESWANKAAFVSDGLSRLSTCYEYFANIEARQFGTVRLTGKYGSQVVRRVTMLKDRSPDMRIFNDTFGNMHRNYAKEQIQDSMGQILKEEIPYVFSTRQSQEVCALTIRAPYIDNRILEIMLRAPELKDTSLPQKHVIRKCSPKLIDIPTNRGNFVEDSLCNRLIGARYKFLNLMDDVYNWERLPPLALQVCRFGDMIGISPFFNGNAEYRHFRVWFLKEMKQFTKGILLDPITLQRPWYNRSFIEQMANSHYSGKVNFTYEIDKIVSFELLLRQNNC